MSNRGRPLNFKTNKQLQDKINEYFNLCQGEPFLDSEGNPVLNKYGEIVIVNAKPPTVTGLALYLGFNGRQSLMNYQEREEFMDTILRAKSRIEEYAETRLYDKDGCNGAKFNLSNNFGWKEKQEVEQTGGTDNSLTINFKIPRPKDDV